jgi:hypothetical protein
MKIPVLTLRQVQEHTPENIEKAVEDVTKVVNGGLLPYYFILSKAPPPEAEEGEEWKGGGK